MAKDPTQEIFDQMSGRFVAARCDRARSYYFSVGDFKYTVLVSPDGCKVASGKTVENADCVLKTTPKIFEKMVLHGKLPGPMDVARGKIKTNDPNGLKALRELFDFSGV